MAYDPKRPRPQTPAEDEPAPVDALIELTDSPEAVSAKAVSANDDSPQADPQQVDPPQVEKAAPAAVPGGVLVDTPPAKKDPVAPNAQPDELLATGGGSGQPSAAVVVASVAALAALLAIILLRRRRNRD